MSRRLLRQFLLTAAVLSLSLVSGAADPAPAPDSWRAVPDLAYSHYLGALAAFPGAGARPLGGALVVGGSSVAAADPATQSPYPEIYDPGTNAWTSFPAAGAPPPLVPARGQLATVVTLHDGRVLVIGGALAPNGGVFPLDVLPVGPGYATTRCDLYLPATNAWQRTGDLPAAYGDVGQGAVVLQDGRVLLCGSGVRESVMSTGNGAGSAGTRSTSSKRCYLYDPVSGSWSAAADMHVARAQFGRPLLLADGRVFICGGSPTLPQSFAFLRAAEVYDPVLDTWTALPDMPGFADEDGAFPQDPDSPAIGSRVRASVGLLPDGRVLIAGGQGQAFLPDMGGTTAVIGARKNLLYIHNVRGFATADIGKSLVTSGAANAGNNGTFTIVHVASPNVIVTEGGDAAVAPDAVSWKVAGSNPLREGSGASISRILVRYRVKGLTGLTSTAGGKPLRLGIAGDPDPTNPHDTASPENHGYKIITRVISVAPGQEEVEVIMARVEDGWNGDGGVPLDAHSGAIAWKIYSRQNNLFRKSCLICDVDDPVDPWTRTADTSIGVGETALLSHPCGGGLLRFNGTTVILGVQNNTVAGEWFDPTAHAWTPIADQPELDTVAGVKRAFFSAEKVNGRTALLGDGTILEVGGDVTAPTSEPRIVIMGQGDDPAGAVIYEAKNPASSGIRIAHVRPAGSSGYTANAALSVVATGGGQITVSLATGADSRIVSTAKQAADAVNADPAASALVKASLTPVLLGQEAGSGLANSTNGFVAVQSASRRAFVYTPAPTSAPSVALAGENPAVLLYGAVYADAGATGVDSCGNPLVPVVVADTVDTGAAGAYEVTYRVTDSAGHQATTTRVVTVIPAPLTITTDDASKNYGQPNPAFTASYSGFVNGDTPASLTGTLTFSTDASAGSGAGTYRVTPGGLGSSNYAITLVPGTLRIDRAALTVAADDKTKILDAPNPVLTATFSGFVLGEDPSALGGALEIGTTAATTSPVGSYPIALSGLASTNYAITLVAGTLRILYQPASACGHEILPPIAVDGTSVFKCGRTVPAKFRVCNVDGVSIGTPGVVSSFHLVEIVEGSAVHEVTSLVPSTTPNEAFRWDPTSEQWIFNVDTKAPVFRANRTYVFAIRLNDGTSIGFRFGLR